MCLQVVGVEQSWQNSGNLEIFLSLSSAVKLGSLLTHPALPEFLACAAQHDDKIDVLNVNDSRRKSYLCRKPRFSLSM